MAWIWNRDVDIIKWKEKELGDGGGICLLFIYFYNLLFPPHLSSWRETPRRRRKRPLRWSHSLHRRSLHHRQHRRWRQTRCPPSPSTMPTLPRSSRRSTIFSKRTSSTSRSRRRCCTRLSTSRWATRQWCSRCRLCCTRCV